MLHTLWIFKGCAAMQACKKSSLIIPLYLKATFEGKHVNIKSEQNVNKRFCIILSVQSFHFELEDVMSSVSVTYLRKTDGHT